MYTAITDTIAMHRYYTLLLLTPC